MVSCCLTSANDNFKTTSISYLSKFWRTYMTLQDPPVKIKSDTIYTSPYLRVDLTLKPPLFLGRHESSYTRVEKSSPTYHRVPLTSKSLPQSLFYWYFLETFWIKNQFFKTKYAKVWYWISILFPIKWLWYL